FFLTDLYGDRDYSARDEGLARVSGLMIRMMPTAALDSIADGLEMHAVTQELDKGMIDMLFDEMALIGRISAADYGEAYRRCDSESGRLRQLTLVAKVGRDLDTIVHKSSIYHLVRMAHYPAHLAGFGALQDFIERGFDAFLEMGGADEFLTTITRRERRVHEAIMDGAETADWAPAQPV
ncbi:MAG: FFLEELY motif protein, partial [Gammaproteobacteria bacterium]